MNAMRTIGICLFLLATLCGDAQSYRAQCDRMLTASSEQWLMAKFSKQYPQLGKDLTCPPPFNSEIQSKSALEVQLEPFLVNKEVENWAIQQLLKDDCKRLIECKALFDLYSPLFERHLVSRKMDTDISYFPIVLSGLNPEWIGPKGESGLWQLDYLTSRKLQLSVNGTVDERKAADIATKAAISQLQLLLTKYSGDYVKALSAYLKGERFADELTTEQILEVGDIRDQLTLLAVSIRLMKNFETQPQLMKWLEWLNSYEVVPLYKTVYKEVLSEAIGWDIAEMNGLNPVFLSDSIPGKFRNVPFLIPGDKLAAFEAAGDAVYDKPEPVALVHEVSPITGNASTYLVKPGDVLGAIAQHHGVSVRQIKDWNDLNSDRIQIGQELVLYPKRTVIADPVETSSRREAQTPVNTKNPVTYVVKPGESLWLISRKYSGVSAEEIMEWNAIDDAIQPGQKLLIYPKN